MLADLSTWLATMVWPLASKVLVSLGMGFLVFTGADAAINSALTAAKDAMGGMGLEVGLLVARFGFFDYMSITSGGLISGLTWMHMKRLAVTGTAVS